MVVMPVFIWLKTIEECQSHSIVAKPNFQNTCLKVSIVCDPDTQQIST